MFTLWGAVIVAALILIAIGVWLLTRDTPPPPLPGRHRQPPRDPHDPIRQDDEEPPEQGDPPTS